MATRRTGINLAHKVTARGDAARGPAAVQGDDEPDGEGGRQQLSFHPELRRGEKMRQESTLWKPAKRWCQEGNLPAKQPAQLPSPFGL